MAKQTVGFVGAGRVARIILGGLKKAGHMPATVVASDINADVLKQLQSSFPEAQTALNNNREAAEEKLEAYAIVTAMGPTYLWFQLDELRSLAESFGMSAEEAKTGIAEMVGGAVKTLTASGMSAVQVMDLIPVKPLGEEEANIKAMYRGRLDPLYKKLKG